MKFITNLKNNLARTALTLLLAVLTTSAWAIQQDPDDGYYLISSAQDWQDFATGISDGTIATNANARLTADNITVSSMIGTENRKYAGTFEGNNYNIISAINATGRYVAPFSYVNGATIQNLTISGSVNGGIHCSGLIGCSNGTNTVSNVTINASITTSDSHCGGFIGHGFSSNVTFTNCVFAGEIHGRSANSLVGVFNGWSGNNISLNNCIEKGTYTNCNPFYPLGYGIGNVTNTYYLTAPSSGETKGTRAYSTMPEGEVCGQILAVDGNNYYVSTVISGINDRYELLGSSVTPEPIVTFLGNTLTENADYTLSYNNNTSGGTGSVTITGIGSYSGAKTIEFQIAATTLSGSGTEESPFIINSDADWTSFATSVNSGYTYTGLFVKMTNSVNAACMAGQREGEPFSGTFDGDGYTLTLAIVNSGSSTDINNPATGTAPFHYIKNATIKNVKTVGTVSATAIHASGLVGMADGTNTIQGCTVSAIINTTSNYVGGILAHGITSNTTIRDCVFDGTINGRSGGSSYLCGIYGWCHGGSPVITNCIEKGTYTNVGSYFNPIYMNNGNTTATVSGTYYTTPKTNGGNDYGTQVFATIPEGEMCGKVTAVDGLQHYVVTTVSGINERYVLTGASVEPVPTVKFFNTTLVNGTDYTVAYSNNTSGGTGFVIITGTETAYWGVKTVNFIIAANTLPGGGTVESPYTISDADHWNEFVNSVNNGFSYSGKIVQLTANININSSVGLREDFPFSGTFDGAGHTLTANITANGANTSGNIQGVAPFHFIKNATIKNLRIAGAITSTEHHTAGLVGFASGTNTIQSCVVSATLNVSGNYVGGFIGHSQTSSITITDCLFDGTIARQTSSGNPAAGLWGWKDGGSAVITNCLENGTYTNCTNVDAIGWVPSITISNTYRINNSSRGTLTTAEELSNGTTTAALQNNRPETIWVQDPVTNQPMLKLFATPSFTFDVTGYGTGNDKWYLIASPVVTINPENVRDMISNSYDLYRFNPSAALEWENWKNSESNHYHFNLESGRGYLYANSEDVTLVFSGTPYSGNGQVTLSKDDNARFGKWNLIGNPFSQRVYLTGRDFYVMNDEGTEIVSAERNYIEPMEGVFVLAATDGETLTFSTEQSGNPTNPALVLNISQMVMERGGASTLRQAQGSTTAVIDRAIVRFGEERSLPKFQIRDNSTKVYIPKDGNDYAIVSVGRDGVHTVSTEVPINFKASENGTYTLSANLEGVEMSYLHLIDNMTGADVDLLQTSAYTFTAKTTDYESRFKLVFVCGDANDDNGDNEAFAFFSNGNIIIPNASTDAVLQVVDAIGRVIVSRDGVHTVSTNEMTPGVYVLRLIEGKDVKTQKIIVK
jgi:hypothetical protein